MSGNVTGPRLGRLLLCLLAVALPAAVQAAPAAAQLARVRPGGLVGYAPLAGTSAGAGPMDSAFSNVDYGGGPVMASDTNLTVAWAPAGYGYQGGYVAGVDRFFSDLQAANGSPADSEAVATQYMDASGDRAGLISAFGGNLADGDAYPASGCPAAAGQVCLTDAQLEAELDRFLAAGGLPRDLTHEYFLLLPPQV